MRCPQRTFEAAAEDALSAETARKHSGLQLSKNRSAPAILWLGHPSALRMH